MARNPMLGSSCMGLNLRIQQSHGLIGQINRVKVRIKHARLIKLQSSLQLRQQTEQFMSLCLSM